MRTLRVVSWIAVAAVLLVGSSAQAIQFHFIDFEDLTDLTSITNQYASQHATFSNAMILTSGSSLNEIDFPPHSGSNVAYNNFGVMRIDFGSTAYDWSAFFTYNAGVSVKVWDEFDNLLGTTTSAYSENYTTSANPFANEQLSFSSASGFRAITIEGFAGSGDIVMDDMSYSMADAPAAVPEPGTLVLFASGLAASGLTAIRARFRKRG
jgi:hypothetical protein